jgi:deoxyribose-phosphate aldolase
MNNELRKEIMRAVAENLVKNLADSGLLTATEAKKLSKLNNEAIDNFVPLTTGLSAKITV